MGYTLIGNSITRFIQPESFRETICMPGAPLKVLLRVAAATPGVAVVLCGIPDVCYRNHHQVDLWKIAEFRHELDRFREWSGEAVILPFYPPAYLSQSNFDTIQMLNDKIKQINRFD